MENSLPQTAPLMESPQTTPPSRKIGKWRGGFLIAQQSFALLRADKEILLFPILSIVCSLILCALFIIVAFFFLLSGYGDSLMAESATRTMTIAESVVVYGALFVIYIVGAFITAFFQAGLVTIVSARINGKDFTFRDGMRNAVKNSRKIFLWAVVTSTVGIVLQFISDRSKLLGKIVAFFLGAAWGIITYFIVPVLALEDLSPKDSIKRSAEIFRATWGETLVVNFSTGLLLLLLLIGGIGVYALSWFTGSMIVIAVMSLVFFLFFITTILVFSTLNTVFNVALYEYAAHHKSSGYFTPELLSGAIGKK